MHFDPATPYHTMDHLDAESRLDLARIVAMQLKPELLVEQLMIESRLRTMNIENLQQLNLEGVAVDPKSIHKVDRGAWLQAVKSKSTPALGSLPANSHRKSRRRRDLSRHQGLDWCTLNPAPEDVLGRRSHFTSNGKVYVGVDASQGTKYRLPQLIQTSPVATNMHDPLAMRTQHGPLEQFPQAMRTQHGPLNPSPQATRSEYTPHPNRPLALGGQARAVGQSMQIPVVEPALGPERAGLGMRLAEVGGIDYWKQNPVKHVSKLKSLGWW